VFAFVCVCVCVCVCVHVRIYVYVCLCIDPKTTRVGPTLPCESWGLNLGQEDWQQMPLLAEPSCWPGNFTDFLRKMKKKKKEIVFITKYCLYHWCLLSINPHENYHYFLGFKASTNFSVSGSQCASLCPPPPLSLPPPLLPP